MKDIAIRKFEHTDVEAFIRLAQLSFAEENLAIGITAEDFARETRRIFRWKMLPYKLLTALMGVQWEAFVAEKDGRVVGGGMYMGREGRMSLTNLMVDPAYRRQGIGQALLLKRLERLKERGFPYVTAQVLDTNTASLANLAKQGFEVFNRYSIYERALPVPKGQDTSITIRDIRPADRVLFRNIEAQTMPASIISINGSLESQYFLSGWQKLYARFTGYSRWVKAFSRADETVGFVYANCQRQQRKGLLLQPVVADEHLPLLPAMIYQAGAWLGTAGKEAIIIEIPDRRTQIRDYLLENGWSRQHTWLELIYWLNGQGQAEIQ